MPVYWILLAVAAFFLLDAAANLGIFKTRRSWQRRGEWSARYGPVERIVRLVFGAGFVGVMGLVGLRLLLLGGLDALHHPNDYLGKKSRPPAVPVATEPAPAPAPPSGDTAPASPPPAERELAPPVEAEPRPAASPPPEPERRLWIYTDDEGVTRMVDAEEKIPAAFRATARPLD